ncbi:MAG: S8/S53 family peptidase [Polyangiaceae bacterium]
MRTSMLTGLVRLAAAGLLPVLLSACVDSNPEPVDTEVELDSSETQGLASPTANLDAPKSKVTSAPDMTDEASRPAREREPILELDTSPPESEALAAAIERVRSEAPAPDEVFALITLKDRKTGEKRQLTRGVPRPEYARYIADPQSAPEGLLYGESDDVDAGDDVMIVRRIVTEREDLSTEHVDEREVDEAELKDRNKDSGLFHRIEDGIWNRVRSGEIDITSNQPVRVIFELKDVPRLRLPKLRDTAAGGLLYTGLDVAAARERAILDRKVAMQKLQAPISQAMAAVGGKVTYSSWTAGTVEGIVPASAIDLLARRGDVFSVDYNEIDAETGYKGDDIYTATKGDQFEGSHSGFGGLSSKHSSTSRILMGIREPCLDVDTPALLSTSASSSSRADFFDCDENASCTGTVEDCSATDDHGTHVVGLALGDFMDNQDSAVSATNARQMTGTCQECQLAYLQDQNLDDRNRTLDKACELGVDIYSASWGTTSISCDGNGSYDSNLEALVDCDAVFVVAAGNFGSGSGCSTSYPADDPWTFTVGGVDTSGTCDTAAEWYTSTCDHASGASIGGASYDSGTGDASLIDLAGPYTHSGLIAENTANPVTMEGGSGTSYATPTVSGLMAMMMDWYQDNVSTSIFFNNRMRNFMLLMGDRSTGTAGTSRLINDTSIHWGAGRVGLVDFDSLSYNLLRNSNTIAANDTVTFSMTIKSSATFFKAAVWHDGKNYANEPGIDLTINPTGCSSATKSVSRFDSKVILAFNGTGDLNGCTGMDITLTNNKHGLSGSRVFHFAAYSTTTDER